LKMWK